MKTILFVCLGNICRSPAAEAVMSYLVGKEGLQDQIKLDSAGTSAYHEGEPADARMRAAGKRRGFDLTSISRKVRERSDFVDFDLIVAMDDENFHNLTRIAPANAKNKVVKMCDYCENRGETEVPDPYYGGADGFGVVLDILEDACSALLKELKEDGL